MMTIQLDMYQACALGALVYCLGRFMVKKLGFLSKYCIPAPVAGGIVSVSYTHLDVYKRQYIETLEPEGEEGELKLDGLEDFEEQE